MSRIDWAAVRFGVLRGVAAALPLAIVAQVLVGDENEDPPTIAFVLFLLVLLALTFAGWCAAQRAIDTPYATGAVAALVTFAVIQAIGIVSVALRGDTIHAASIVFNGLLAYGCGLLGAALTVRQRAT